MSQGRKVDFGFGCMRLPVLQADQPDSFDYEKIEQLFDAFLKKGFTYFDTAYTYHGYHAEEAVRKALSSTVTAGHSIPANPTVGPSGSIIFIKA